MRTVLRTNIVSISILAVGLGIAAMFFHLNLKSENTSNRVLFQLHAVDQTIELLRVLEHNIQAPLSVASLFSTSQDVTKEEFRTFTQPLLKQFSSLQALQWAPVISQDNLAAFEQSAKKYFKAFKITEKDINGKMIAISARAHYVPVFFCEPISGNKMSHGYDLASNKNRKLMLAYSRDTANSSLSAKLNLVQDHSKKTGILVAHPVYQRNSHPDSLQQKRALIKGYSIAVLVLDDIITKLLKKQSKNKIVIYITDITNKSRPQLIFGGDTNLGNQQNLQRVSDKLAATDLKMSKTYQLHNRTWNVQILPMHGFYAMTASWRTYAVVFIILFFTMVILFFIKTIRNNAHQLTKLVVEKDQEIKQRKKLEKALKVANTQLEEMSFTDALLGIYNRRKFDLFLDHEWQRGLRSHMSLSLILIDVDNFKSYNDHYGHVEGDNILQEIAKAISICANRTTDLAARYGGDEIVIVLPETNIDGAITIAENIRKTVLFMSIPHIGNDEKSIVTVSAGVGCTMPVSNMLPCEFIAIVDSALYQAKKNGRNTIESINNISNYKHDSLDIPKQA